MFCLITAQWFVLSNKNYRVHFVCVVLSVPPPKTQRSETQLCRPCILRPRLFAFPKRAGRHTENVHLLRSFKKQNKSESHFVWRKSAPPSRQKLRPARGVQCHIPWRTDGRHFHCLSHAHTDTPQQAAHGRPTPHAQRSNIQSAPHGPSRALPQEAGRVAGRCVGSVTLL